MANGLAKSKWQKVKTTIKKYFFRQIIADFIPEWKEIGFKWFGGCCRTTPEDIKNIRSAVFKK